MAGRIIQMNRTTPTMGRSYKEVAFMNYENEQITKDELVDAVDAELSELDEDTRYIDRDSDFFQKLEIFTYARNAIYDMPISDYTASLMYGHSPSILRDIYHYWEDSGLNWGPGDQKLSRAIDLVEDWMNNIERTDLTHALYRRMETELTQYANVLKKQTPDEILGASMHYVVYNAICSMLEPDNNYDLRDISTLLTMDEPIAAVYQEWFRLKPRNINEDDIRYAIRGTMENRRDEIESHPSLSRQNPDTARYLDLYIHKYCSDSMDVLPLQEHVVGLEP